MGIARSSFYERPATRIDDAVIVTEMKAISDEFEAYGYRRVTAELRHRGRVVNSKKVRRLMREHELNPKQRRRFVATTDSDHDGPIFPNLATDIFVGKARRYNRRFLQMCSHHLIEPVACTPASGWEKGQVENQVGNLRDQFFRPKPRVKSLAELNAWLEDQCIAYAKRIRHPEFKERTIWDVFQEERASLMELRGPFDGFVEKAVRASTTCLIMSDHNRYSVDARAAGRMVLVRTHAEHIVVLLGDEIVADHPRSFRRDQIVYDPWHYLPVLMKKPGALRNGAPFKDWALPPALTQVRAKLKGHADGDRQFVKVLGAVLDYGLGAVDAACAEALQAGIASGDVILTVLARRREPAVPPSITTPDALRLKIEPMADCGRYDSIRKVA